MFHGKLPQHARTAYCTPTCARASAYAWARTDDASGKPTQFWNEIHCTCARDNIYQAPVLLVGGLGTRLQCCYHVHVCQSLCMHACMHEGVYQGKQVYTGHALILQLGSCKYTQCAIKHEGVYQVNSTIATLYNFSSVIHWNSPSSRGGVVIGLCGDCRVNWYTAYTGTCTYVPTWCM